MFPDAPVNGTDNFFEELYDYRNASLEDSFDTMDVHQVAGQVSILCCRRRFHFVTACLTLSALLGPTFSTQPSPPSSTLRCASTSRQRSASGSAPGGWQWPKNKRALLPARLMSMSRRSH